MGKIVIPARDRLRWYDQMARDRQLSHLAFRTGCIIGSHFNNETGLTFVGLDTLARELAVSRRSAWDAVQELQGKDSANASKWPRRQVHIDVVTGGGRKKANEYRMVLGPLGNGATDCTVLPSETVQSGARNGATDCTVLPSETVQSGARNGATDCTPTLKSFSSSKRKNSHSATNQRASLPRDRGAGRQGTGATFSVKSPEMQAWIDHYQAIGNDRRASLLRHQVENSHTGKWVEATRWPPPRIATANGG